MAVTKHGVSSNTPDRVLIDSGAVYIGFISADEPGTLLGATRGGNVWELTRNFREMPVDGARGKVKGLRRLESVDAKLTVNLLEVTAANLNWAIGASQISLSSGTTAVVDEAVGTGDASEVTFALDQSPIVPGTFSVAVVDRGTQVEGTDYAVDYDNGTVTFVTAPENLKAITASYYYVSGSAIITGEEVDDAVTGNYVPSVAIVGTLQGYTNPIICKLTNALADAGVNLNFADKDELVTQVAFSGHYLASALSTEPWSVEYPAS